MMRQLMILAVVVLVAAPDWATAFGRRRFRPAPVAVAYCPPMYVVVPPCLPAFDVYPVAPVVSAPALAAPTVTSEPARPEPAKPEPVPKPPTLSLPKVQADPTPDPRTVRPAEFTPSAAQSPPVPAAEPGTLLVPPPPVGATNIPATPVPMGGAAAAPGQLDAAPKLAPRLPPGADGLPALNLPTGPATTTKSSPLSGGPRFEVIPVDGPPAAGAATRTVGFFNLTDRDVTLTVEGQTVTLPRKHQISAAVPPAFRWKFGDGPEQPTTVPAGAAGVEVLLRR